VNLLAGREIHCRIGAPQRGPAELLHFLLNRRGDHRVADVRVDLHQEVAADDHRLEFQVIDVGGNNGAAARHFGPHEIGGETLAERDELHLRGDLTAPCIVELCHYRRAAARCHPLRAHLGQALAWIEALRAAGVVVSTVFSV
jgi:hypothetical protein